MSRNLKLPVGLLAGVVLLSVLIGRADAAIRFRSVTISERLMDPTRYYPRYGLSSALWDTTKVDSLAPEVSDTLQAAPDSVKQLPEQISKPDSLKKIPSEGIDGTIPASGATSSTSTAGGTTSASGEIIPPSPDESFKSKREKQKKPGEDKTDEEGAEKEEQKPPPYHPTLVRTVEPEVRIKTEYDTTTGYIVFRNSLGDTDLPHQGALSPEAFLDRMVINADRDAWRKSVLDKMPKEIKKEGTGINISIPVFKSKRTQRIFGGSNIGLSVSGNIEVSGKLTMQKKEELQGDNPNPTDYSFNINQTQNFVIKGKVGEKVDVDISQDSENLFDFENNLSIRYTGYDDEILQSFEAGNISLSLGGASLVSGSGSHKGLFGFKSVSRLGALKVTTIASLEKGEKQKITKGSSTEGGRTQTIYPTEYIKWRYFFLDEYYRERFKKRRAEDLTVYSVPDDSVIAELNVWKSLRNFTGLDISFVQGYALNNPDQPFNPDSLDKGEFSGSFQLLTEGADYTFNPNHGYIRFEQTLSDDDVIAVSFKTLSYTVGDPDPGDNDFETNPFRLKVIKSENPQSDYETWNLAWRHAYSLKATNIALDGFEGKIVNTVAGEEEKDIGTNTDGQEKTYIEMFGLDWLNQTGGLGQDGAIDQIFIRPTEGELWFPDLQPFDPEGWYRDNTLTSANYNDTLKMPDIYTKSQSELDRTSSDLRIVVKSSSVSATYDLGWGVLEGSVEVTLNGQKLSPGIDYSVDYITGELTILRASAMQANADVEIQYETGKMFQLDTKTLLGLRAEYELWDDSHIGTTWMYLNQKTLEQRVRIGGEPMRNSIWDVDASLKFLPYFLTQAVDWLPLIETDDPSTLTFEGEFAQVFPDPNNLNSPSTGDNNGVAYVDDFESIKRITPLGINRRQWSAASFPEYHKDSQQEWDKKRGRLIWYNPHDQIEITEIWEDREVEAQNSTIPVLTIEMQPWWTEWGASKPDTVLDPEAYWGGIMRYLGASYADQTESKFIEIWLNRGNAARGVMYIDLGKISEDVIPNRILNNEDLPEASRPTGNGILESNEDTGLDQIDAKDPDDKVDINDNGVLLPSYDDWKYSVSNRNDYSHLNGTENNMNDEGGRFPDTEDINSNNSSDRYNDFFRYKIDFSELDKNDYIVGGLENQKGWRLYRIPLTDTLVTGNPRMSSLEYARIWFTGFARPAKLMIAELDIVGNEWSEEEITDAYGDRFEPVSVSTINTHDNPEYDPPPGVSGEIDPITRLEAKEQSLVLKVNRLGTGQTGEVIKQIPGQQNIKTMNDYRTLKMFVHGGNLTGRLEDRFGRPLDLEVFLRFGSNKSSRYYEYSQRLHPGWDSENEIIIDFDRLQSLAYLRLQDSTRNYDVLPNGDVLRIVGEPSLRSISFFSVGIKNHGQDITEQDEVEVWFDELRVSDIHREPGWAVKGGIDLKIAGRLLTANVNMSQTQSDFHNVNSRMGTDNDVLTGNFSSGFALDALFDPKLGMSIPINYRFGQTVRVPVYDTRSDVRLSTLTGKKIDIWSIFADNLQSNDRYSPDPKYQTVLESQLNTTKSYSYGISISKNKYSENPFLAYTLERIQLRNLSYSKTLSSDNSYMYKDARRTGGDLSYSLSLNKPVELRWLSWAANVPLLGRVSENTFNPFPSSLNLGTNLDETLDQKQRRESEEPEDDIYKQNLDRNFGIDWRPISIFSAGYSQTTNAERIRTTEERQSIIQRLSDLDSTEYWGLNGDSSLFDSTGWADTLASETKRLYDRLFWEVFGAHYIDNSFSQNMSFSFNPTLVSWLTTTSNYNPRYSWRWGNGAYGKGERSVEVSTSLSTNVTFRLTQVMRSWLGDEGAGRNRSTGENDNKPPPWMEEGLEKLEDKPTNTGSMVDPMLDPMLDIGSETSSGDVLPSEPLKMNESPADSLSAKKPVTKKGQDPLMLLRAFLTNLKDISWNYTQGTSTRNYAVDFGQANWWYRLGLQTDPKMKRVEGYAYNDSYSRDDVHRFSSGLDITQNLSISSFSYTYGWSRAQSQGESGTYTRTVWQYFDNDGVSVKTFPAVNWTIRWSGWEQMRFISPWASSLSLSNNFTGSSSESWRKSVTDTTRQTVGIDYEKNFTPLIGIDIGWGNGISSDISYNITQSVSDQPQVNKTLSKTNGRSLRISGSYNSRKGFKIPIPTWPFKNRRFKNNTTFSLAFESNANKTQTSTGGNPFSTSRDDSNWSLEPSIKYQFSNMVTGGFNYVYAVQQSKLTGKTTSQDFRFNVNISIRG